MRVKTLIVHLSVVLLIIAILLLTACGMTGGSGAQPSPPSTVARDGRSLASQSSETQATFKTIWGDRAAEQWVVEHNATLPDSVPTSTLPHMQPTLVSLPRRAILTASPGHSVVASTDRGVLVEIMRAGRNNDQAQIGRLGDAYGSQIMLLNSGQPVTVEELADQDGWHLARARLSTGTEVWLLATDVV